MKVVIQKTCLECGKDKGGKQCTVKVCPYERIEHATPKFKQSKEK